jgi:Domain of unknown function (DUF5666)
MKVKEAIVVIFFSALIANAGALLPQPAFGSPASLQTQESSQNTIARRIGTIKTINGSAITLAPDSGPPVAVTVQPNARILRIAPGEKDLKNATPVQLQDLQVGDTIRVRGYASADGQSINGLEVIVITRAAVQAVSEQIRQDWQKRGVGGVVDSVDPASGIVTLSVPGLTGKKTIVVHTSKNTIVRRYAPDSAKPEDAKTTTLQGIQVGDQLRARGNRNADGSEITAEEIYTGVFPRWVGTIKSIDANAGTLTVQDLATKKTVQVKVTADSQLHKIPAEMAQRFAMRLKSMLPPGTPGADASSPANSSTPGNNKQGAPATAPQSADMGSGGGTGGMRPGGAPDFQQIVSRLPSSTLADLQLQKGDAVVILATEGTPSSAPTAITLLSGVEPILQAAPNGSQAMMLAPWTLGGAPGGDALQ